MSNPVETQLRARAAVLLAEGAVELFLGYRQGTNPLRVAPFAARTPAEAERLVWNAVCVPNLAGALLKHAGRRVGVALKGCDARTVAELLRENQLQRERLHIVGVACQGMADPDRLAASAGAALISMAEDGDELLLAKCASCSSHTPPIYDELIGEAPQVVPVGDRMAGLRALEALDAPGRLAFWSEQLSRCTLCYACQTVCPLCYCKQCPLTLPRDDVRRQTREPASVFSYHLMRAYHLSERCTGCDECERVCPEDIPLSLIYRKVERDRRPG